MYNPTKQMTQAVLADVLAEFEWPAPYSLDDDWLPDGIAMEFARCTVLFTEGFESDIDVKFLPDDTNGLTKSVRIVSALHAKDHGRAPTTPGLTRHYVAGATHEKVQEGIRNMCRMLLTHFRETLLGDFAWVKHLAAPTE